MKLLIYISVIVSAVALAYFVLSLFEMQSARERLGLKKRRKIPNALIINIFYPVIQVISEQLSRLKMPKVRVYLKNAFIYAGLDDLLSVEEFWAFQVVTLVLFFVMWLMLSGSPFGFVVGMALGIIFPLQWLKGMAKKRREEIMRAMPAVVDLLTLSVEAGLDFLAAMVRVAEGSRENPLIKELKRMLDEIKVGASRAEGLRHLAVRCNVSAVTSFTALLIQADKLGASIGPVLRAQSDKLRTDRFQRAERAGAAAAQKILFPLVFFIIPAVFIVIFGPIVIQLITKGFGF